MYDFYLKTFQRNDSQRSSAKKLIHVLNELKKNVFKTVEPILTGSLALHLYGLSVKEPLDLDIILIDNGEVDFGKIIERIELLVESNHNVHNKSEYTLNSCSGTRNSVRMINGKIEETLYRFVYRDADVDVFIYREIGNLSNLKQENSNYIGALNFPISIINGIQVSSLPDIISAKLRMKRTKDFIQLMQLKDSITPETKQLMKHFFSSYFNDENIEETVAIAVEEMVVNGSSIKNDTEC